MYITICCCCQKFSPENAIISSHGFIIGVLYHLWEILEDFRLTSHYVSYISAAAKRRRNSPLLLLLWCVCMYKGQKTPVRQSLTAREPAAAADGRLPSTWPTSLEYVVMVGTVVHNSFTIHNFQFYTCWVCFVVLASEEIPSVLRYRTVRGNGHPGMAIGNRVVFWWHWRSHL